MNPVIVWVHGDHINPQHPALMAHPEAPALFVFDDTLLAEWAVSLKRLVFMYECLLEMPVTIRRGDVAAEVAAFAAAHQAETIATTPSPSPHFRVICAELRRQGYHIAQFTLEPFLSHEPGFDLKRFSRYWQAARPYAFGREKRP